MAALLTVLVTALLGIWMIAKQPARLRLDLVSDATCRRGAWVSPENSGAGNSARRSRADSVCHDGGGGGSTSSSWMKEPELVMDHGWPSLGSLGKITPVFVLGQIALGAAFRHKALGVMPHLVGAMVIVMLILCICIFVMQQFPTHATCRPCANLLMAIAFTQIFLGIAAFTVRTMTTQATPVVIGVTSAHATVGALTLAVAVVLHMQIRRNVFPIGRKKRKPRQRNGLPWTCKSLSGSTDRHPAAARVWSGALREAASRVSLRTKVAPAYQAPRSR